MINFIKFFIILAIVMNFSSGSIANATVLLNSYADPDFNGYYTLGDAGSRLAIGFTVTSNTTIDTIQTGIQGTGNINLLLTSAVSGVPSPTALYSLALINPVADIPHSSLGWALTPGQYFLTETTDAGFVGSWINTFNAGNPWLFSINSGATWLTPPSFQSDYPPTALITTSAVPIPAAFWLFGSALMGLVSRRKNKILALNPAGALVHTQKIGLVKISPQNAMGAY